MSKPIKLTCPLGATCRTETAEEISQCHWYEEERYEQEGEVKTRMVCAITKSSRLQFETAKQTHLVGIEIGKLREEVTNSETIATNTAARLIGANVAMKQIADDQPQIQKV